MSRNHTHTRRRALALIGSTGAIGLAGCLGGDDDAADDGNGDDGMDDDREDDHDDDEYDEDDGRVRVAHLSPDAPNVDVWVDGDAVLEDVPYRTVSDYLELAPDTYAVEITAAGDPETVVFDDDLEVGDGDYTVAAIGELAEENHPFEVRVFEDDLSDPGEEARVRLVHASPDAPAVDVTVGDGETVLFEDADFGDAAALEVAPDAYDLEVRGATDDADGDVVATFPVEPGTGNVYTAFAVGYLEHDAAPADEPFDLEVVLDESHADEYDDEAETVAVGPDGENRFEPDVLEVDPGTTVRFHWESGGHNVVPESMPDGAAWEGVHDVQDADYEHEHAFEYEGVYEYVCEPHEGAGMVGEIHVGDVDHEDDDGDDGGTGGY